MDSSQLGLSVASLAGYSLPDALETGRRLGFDAVEILGFENERHSQGDLCGFEFAERTLAEHDRLREMLTAYRHVSVHAPFINVPLLANNAGVCREAYRQTVACVEGIAHAGGSLCTVHLNMIPFASESEWELTAVDLLRRLGDVGAMRGVRLAVETGYPNTVDRYCGIIEATDHPMIGACIDVGHIFHYYPHSFRGTAAGIELHNNTLNEIVARLGGRVALFHLHDNRSHDFRDHRAVGRGIIDFPRLVETLRAAEFSGPLVFELEEPDFIPALEQSRDHFVSAMSSTV